MLFPVFLVIITLVLIALFFLQVHLTLYTGHSPHFINEIPTRVRLSEPIRFANPDVYQPAYDGEAA